MSLPMDLPEQLQGLVQMARANQLDMRTVLLRVMTDLYLSKPQPTAEETRQFEELSLEALPYVDDPEVRLTVAGKLAGALHVPESILCAFVAGGGAPAARILAQTTMLSRKTLLRAAMEGDGEMALAIAGRSDLDAMIVTALASRDDLAITRVLAKNVTAPLSREVFKRLSLIGRTDAEIGRALCQRSPDLRDCGPLFLWASHLQRASVLLEAKTSLLAHIEYRAATDIERATGQEIERAAVAGDWPLFAAIIARALGCPLTLANRIVSDPLGEPLVIALGSLFLTAEQVTRILMCPGAPVTHSFERMQSLVQTYRQLPRPVCAKLMRDMLGRPDRDADTKRVGVHVTYADQGAAERPSRAVRSEHRDASRARAPGLSLSGRRA